MKEMIIAKMRIMGNYILDRGTNESTYNTLNILYQEGNVFIMDNHLAAIWCWARTIDLAERYSFLHIDRHDDLEYTTCQETFNLFQNLNLHIEDVSIEEFTDFGVTLPDNRRRQSFVWDNYINMFSLFNSNIFTEAIFSTQEYGESILPQLQIKRKENWYLQENILFLLRNGQERDRKWVVNLDIDYFFTGEGEDIYQYLTDDFIVAMSNQLKSALDEKLISVLTIAISPECCGGWKNSLRIANLISQQMNLGFSYIERNAVNGQQN